MAHVPGTFGAKVQKSAKAGLNVPRPKASGLDKALLWTLIHSS
jgi:hypothetical protein